MFIEEIARLDASCDFQQSRLRRSLTESELALYDYIDRYLRDYCKFCQLSAADVLAARERFTSRYQKDLLNYEAHGKYPYQLGIPPLGITRAEYDLVLILSFLIEKHRFRIASWLSGKIPGEDVLCVGVGPGVELGIIAEFQPSGARRILGYDVDVSEFVARRYASSVRRGYFSPDGMEYDDILLIEILEHLADPEDLLRSASRALKPHGRMILTTAIDIPQFDHLYNFVPGEIVSLLSRSDLDVEELIAVEHVLNIRKVSSANELVIARKPSNEN